MKKVITLLITIVLIFSVPVMAYCHSGGLDSNGGHWDEATGTYHYHTKSGVTVTKNKTSQSYSDFVKERQSEIKNDYDNLKQRYESLNEQYSYMQDKYDLLSQDYDILLEWFVFIFASLLIIIAVLITKHLLRKNTKKLEKKKLIKIKAAEEEKKKKQFINKRRQFKKLYGERDISNIISVPKGIRIDKYGYFLYSTDIYTFYYSIEKDVFHISFNCCGKFKYDIHLDSILLSVGSNYNHKVFKYLPCEECANPIPYYLDNIDWFRQYLIIMRIKTFYGIDEDNGKLRHIPKTAYKVYMNNHYSLSKIFGISQNPPRKPAGDGGKT